MKVSEFRTLIREEVKKTLNKSSLNEAKKEKFLLYTNPNNSTNRAYVAIGSAGVKDVMGRARNIQAATTFYIKEMVQMMTYKKL